MDEITLGTVFRRCDDVRYRIIDGEAVVIRQDAGEVLGLNEVGSRLLDLIDSKTTVAALLGLLAQEFDVEAEQLQKDVLGFLRELSGAGVIEPA